MIRVEVLFADGALVVSDVTFAEASRLGCFVKRAVGVLCEGLEYLFGSKFGRAVLREVLAAGFALVVRYVALSFASRFGRRHERTQLMSRGNRHVNLAVHGRVLFLSVHGASRVGGSQRPDGTVGKFRYVDGRSFSATASSRCFARFGFGRHTALDQSIGTVFVNVRSFGFSARRERKRKNESQYRNY